MIPIYFLTPNKLYIFMVLWLYIYKRSVIGQIKVKHIVNYHCDWFEFSIAKNFLSMKYLWQLCTGAQAHLHYMPQETVRIHENCNKPRVMLVYLIMHITTSHLSSHSLKFMSQGIIISMQSQFHDHTQTILRSQHFIRMHIDK